MKILKFRYAAVLAYIVLLGLALLTQSDFLAMVLLMPTGLLLLALELALGSGQGSITGNVYIGTAAGATEFFIIGLFFEWFISYLSKESDMGTGRSKMAKYRKNDGD